MSQRNSEYEPQEDETYVTPDWVWLVLHKHYPNFKTAIDPCPVNYEKDWKDVLLEDPRSVASNPPFTQAQEIAEWCALRSRPCALLLPYAWDTAKSRVNLASLATTKISMSQRIRWPNLEQKKNGPSTVHCWMIWIPDAPGGTRVIYT